MKREIEVFEYAGEIMRALPTGVLLVTEAEECVNAMTIGWGTLGLEWSTPIFTAYIREGRFTRELLGRTGEFVISVPHGEEHAAKVKKALGICGSRSGRDTDKIAVAGLTTVDAEVVQPPAIKEFPLTLECRVVYSHRQSIEKIDRRYWKFYPQEVAGSHSGANKDAHIAVYGEILKSYIIE